MAIRTDLAVERAELGGTTSADLQKKTEEIQGLMCTRVTDAQGGSYLTLDMPPIRQEENGFDRLCEAVAILLGQLAPPLPREAPVLVLGLGNRAVTPDALGPLCCQHVLATRHLVQSEPALRGFRSTCVLAPGVLGTTGLESGEIVLGLLREIAPAMVIAVDALAARRMHRLMGTIQLTDTGIVPGSGVGNARTALTRETLGVPVLMLGVPTVIDTQTIAEDLAEETGLPAERFAALDHPAIITTRDVDQQVMDAARILGYGIDLFLHPQLSRSDLDAFLN